MPRVAVVTDSTAYLPPGVAERFGITVVPLHVVLGTWSGQEAVEVSPADVAKALLSSTVGSEAWNSRDLKSRPH